MMNMTEGKKNEQVEGLKSVFPGTMLLKKEYGYYTFQVPFRSNPSNPNDVMKVELFL